MSPASQTTAITPASRAVRGRIDELLEVVQSVNATLDPAVIAGVIIERAQVWVPLPSWAVISSDLSGQLSVLGDRGLTPEMVPAVRALAASVMHGPEDVVSSASFAAFALVSRATRIGALVGVAPAPRPRALHPGHLGPDVLGVIHGGVHGGIREWLDPASVALDNALRLTRAEALSVTDDLTQLYNSRYLNLVLRREIKRASRNSRALTLLFLDLDGFKSVNDTHGHLQGSRALVEAAALIQASARETDVVARFGGDEFAIVLPETDGQGGLAVGERIRARLASHRFLAGDGLDIRLTASVGVATLPDVTASPDALIQAADRAMYQVKAAGKNGIQAAKEFA